jgi:zinc protease
VVDQPGAAQTALRVTGIGVARDTDDFPALQVLNGALGGMFSSRLNDNLRETKGYTYGIFSYFRYDRTPGPFVIDGSVRTDVTGASVREIFREVNGIRNTPLPPAELAAARDAQVLSLPGQFETNADIGASLAEIFVYGLPPDYYARLPGQLSAVTAAQVQAAARKYLEPERLKVVAVGDRKRILPQLQPLGLGAPEVRDSDGQRPAGQAAGAKTPRARPEE